jgi:solute carrier family 25 folate transporter 32
MKISKSSQSNIFSLKITSRSREHDSIVTPALCGVMSKGITSFLLYPLNVMRTRIQQNQFVEGADMKYKGLSDCFKKIWEIEGPRGFYKGFVASTMRSIPSNAIFFFFFEYYKKLLNRWID